MLLFIKIYWKSQLLVGSTFLLTSLFPDLGVGPSKTVIFNQFNPIIKSVANTPLTENVESKYLCLFSIFCNLFSAYHALQF